MERLTPTQRKQWAEAGYLALPQVLSPNEV